MWDPNSHNQHGSETTDINGEHKHTVYTIEDIIVISY